MKMWRKWSRKRDEKTRNLEVSRRVGKERRILEAIKKVKKSWGRTLSKEENSIAKDCIEGMVNRRKKGGKITLLIIDSLKVNNK